MNGTLALWYEGRTPGGSAGAPRPEVRVHVNLWRDLDHRFNFLDIGLQIGSVDDLGRLYLYFPVDIRTNPITDLSRVMKDESTLKAVFNNVAEVVREEDSFFVISLSDDPDQLTIHHIDVSTDLTIEPVNVPGHPPGATLTFTSSLCKRLRKAGGTQQYVRLRIHLGGAARNLFTTEDRAPGMGLALSQDVVETTEFRLNERRSYPPDIFRRASAGRIVLRSVHYFLIRSKRFQLGSQHQNFRKLRHLEADIWKGYLAYGRASTRASEKQAREMIIYQWRDAAQAPAELDDFIAHASFRALRHQVSLFIVAALVIGGIGNALLNVVLDVIDGIQRLTKVPALPDLAANALAIGLFVVVLCLGWAVAAFRSWWHRRSLK